MLDGKTIFTCPLVAFSQGYCAPEIMEGHCSTKSDVYSYGVVSKPIAVNVYTVAANNFHNFQMVLETYAGVYAYDKEREDKQIVRMNYFIPFD